jgi:hypothetical protein
VRWGGDAKFEKKTLSGLRVKGMESVFVVEMDDAIADWGILGKDRSAGPSRRKKWGMSGGHDGICAGGPDEKRKSGGARALRTGCFVRGAEEMRCNGVAGGLQECGAALFWRALV